MSKARGARWLLFLLVVWAVCAGSPAVRGGVAPAAAAGPSASATLPDRPAPPLASEELVRPLAVLAIGIAIVLGLIIALKINPFIALITAAIVVSLLAPGPLGDRIGRVATAFGEAAGRIGIVIALAAIIGKCMLDSGAADRIVRGFLRWMGERHSSTALLASGYVLGIPVFFDTVFYLLVPLARSLYRTTGKHYLRYVLAIAAGGAITHTLVPPTPGPLLMAANLNIDVGLMILVGAGVALFAAAAGLAFARFIDRRMEIPVRQIGGQPDPEPLDDSQLPSLALSAAPVVLPVVLISSNTVLKLAAESNSALQTAADWSNVIGNANLALLLSTVIALFTVVRQRQLSRLALAELMEVSLMSAGVIILITSAGGAFGAMLKEAQVGAAIETLFAGAGGAGTVLLLIAFSVAAVLKVAQGSSTVAMITASGMLAGVASSQVLGFHPVYLATSIGAGSLVGSWMNDSGFWIVAKMSGMTEVEALKTWTPLLIVLAVTGLLVTLIMSQLLPLA